MALADFFTGYRQTVLRPGELIRTIRIPLPVAPVSAFHKIAKRRFDDISSVAVAYALTLADGVVESVAIGLGGVAATPIRATATEEALAGRPWTAPPSAPLRTCWPARGPRSATTGPAPLPHRHAAHLAAEVCTPPSRSSAPGVSA